MAQLAILVASFSYACAAIYGRRFRELSPLVVAAGMLSGTTVMMTPLALIIEEPWKLTPGAGTIGALLCLAVLNTSLAYLIYFRVLASAGPHQYSAGHLSRPFKCNSAGCVGPGGEAGLERFRWHGVDLYRPDCH